MSNDKNKRILVTGGCGYIGSHTLVDLIDHGYDVVSIDNYYNSSPTVLKGIEKITGVSVSNFDADISDWQLFVDALQQMGRIDGIIHFAALKSVGESVAQPIWYFENNVDGTKNVLKAMDEFDIPSLIFSSSCTVYGNPEHLPVTEETPYGEAESPYGATKQISEIMIASYMLHQKNKSAISLRYFNPAGAHESAIIGESAANKATNLVPVITETAIGKRDTMQVFGDDYPTRDGSCIRDYIHVMDLAHAHTKALDFLLEQNSGDNYIPLNLGIGEGASVFEVIKAFETSSGEKLNYSIGRRRAGDVIAIYAENGKIRDLLGWEPTRDINVIMETAWRWENERTKNG